MEKVMPLVSIIVPNYNHEKYLKQRLESVFNQTYKNFEVILLDDASKDSSVEILNKYAKDPLVTHYIINSENSGSPFKQWQKGIALARGEFIWIAESDDFSELNFLEYLIPCFNLSTVLVYCASININENEIDLGINQWALDMNREHFSKNFRKSGKQELLDHLKFRNTIPNASAVLFRKSTLKRIKIPVEMKFCGDWFLWSEILKFGDIVFICKPFNYFRKHPNTSRIAKEFQIEQVRFKEYFYIIKGLSTFKERIRFIKNYDWIINEWNVKKKKFKISSTFKIGMPPEILFRMIFKK